MATFLAVLELVKLKVLVCVQGERFGEIELTKRNEQDEISTLKEEEDDPLSVGLNIS